MDRENRFTGASNKAGVRCSTIPYSLFPGFRHPTPDTCFEGPAGPMGLLVPPYGTFVPLTVGLYS